MQKKLNRYLTGNEIDYVFFHLSQHVKLSPLIKSKLVLISNLINVESYSDSIIFPLSDADIRLDFLIDFCDRPLPVFYPVLKSLDAYHIDNKGNVIFSHDFLKSAFLILSGYQETLPGKRDWLGRYPHEESLQHQLGFTTYPIVNYYFEIIVQGIEAFCKHHAFPFERKRLFTNFGFFLSHDVDRVAFYHPREVAFKIKQLLGLAPRYYSRALTLKLFFKGLLFLVNPFPKKDPWWNFDEMIELEKELGIRSTFYFLQKEHPNLDSRYRFKDKKISSLIAQLQHDGFEVGLHGTIKSAEDASSLVLQSKDLEEVTAVKPIGVRQHFLRFFYPSTFKNHLQVGLKYDSTLGFAEHEGFRNGYCYPFKPYDFENDTMIDIWELPLNLMEVSVINYRNQTLADIDTASLHLIEEVLKFGGFYSLLWHNCRLDEYQYPGVNKCYRYLLRKIVHLEPEVVTGEQIIAKLNSGL
jgi:hypothetical protein